MTYRTHIHIDDDCRSSDSDLLPWNISQKGSRERRNHYPPTTKKTATTKRGTSSSKNVLSSTTREKKKKEKKYLVDTNREKSLHAEYQQTHVLDSSILDTYYPTHLYRNDPSRNKMETSPIVIKTSETMEPWIGKECFPTGFL